MKVISALNVNGAFARGLECMFSEGVRQESRNGPTLEMPGPVSMEYVNPRERVLFHPVRDCNPFLGFFEALWILEGRDDVKFLSDIVSNMSNYSDDGDRFYGSYGYRLRCASPDLPTLDQISKAIDRLKADPDDRRVTMMIRSPVDMWYNGKDSPCNILVDCKIRDGKLNITVFNRSNDFIWGMTGTNVVQFSTLQEYMAGMIGCGVGSCHQITTSMHVYLNDQWNKFDSLNVEEHVRYTEGHDFYRQQKVKPYDMMQGNLDDWNEDLHKFFEMYDTNDVHMLGWEFKSPYFSNVVCPMWWTLQKWKAFSNERSLPAFTECIMHKDIIAADDYRLAVEQWLNRRKPKYD